MFKQQLRFRQASDEHNGKHLLGDDTYALGKIKTHKLSLADKEALRELPETYDLAEQTSLQVAGRILQDSTLFYSCLHRTDGAKNNRVCQFVFDGNVGIAEVDFYIVASEPLAMLKTCQLSSTTFMGTICSSRLHSENINLLSKYVFYVQKNVVTQKLVPLSAVVKKKQCTSKCEVEVQTLLV